MPRIAPISILLTAWAACSVIYAQPRLIKGPIQDAHRTSLTGHVHPLATAANDIGELDPSTPLPALTLVLRQTAAQQADLDTFLAAQQNPASPDYHHWLTPEQYADRFGASSDDIAKITAWLEQHNLHVTSVGRGRMSVSFTGTAGDVDQALQVSLHRYSVNGRNHFANTADPSLPTALQTAVRSIHGLHDFLMQPRSRLHQAALAPDYTSASGNHYLSPDDLGTIYNIKALWNSGYDGTGQKIVIAGQTRIAFTDIQQFRAKFQLPAADPQVLLVPNTTDPGTVKDDLGEADLDLEWAGATAPQASLIYVFSNDVMDAVQYAIDQNLAPVISLSYGLCEPQTLRSDMLLMQTWARQANAQGITWINASGDSGGADCYTGTSGSGAGLAVDSPADIPEVTGIGGTTFNESAGQFWNPTMAANGGSALAYIPESVWNDSTQRQSCGRRRRRQHHLHAALLADRARRSHQRRAQRSRYFALRLRQSRWLPGLLRRSAFGLRRNLRRHALLRRNHRAAQSVPGLHRRAVRSRRRQRQSASLRARPGRAPAPSTMSPPATTPSRSPVQRARAIASPGSYGYSAGQGYDLASGLGSIDAYNLVTSWHTAAGAVNRAAATVALQATATSVISTGTVTLTATVSGSTGATPTGSVTFLSAGKLIGTATLSGTGSSATAAITVSAALLQVGSNSIVAQYSGDTALNGRRGHHQSFRNARRLRAAVHHEPGKRSFLPFGLRSRDGPDGLRFESRGRSLGRVYRAAAPAAVGRERHHRRRRRAALLRLAHAAQCADSL